jgi:hypothetical protein
MTSPAEYRELALKCMREADHADNATMRLTMLGLARIWMSVAVEMNKRVMLPDDDHAQNGNGASG